eukprot:TRINITY_DN40236_c0_g1_i1.p1 TRINITY_DN40236_c0_g1~~TRINITY_DN40236_c0_g1_i1.p1  ORF type:complete len:289 (+),score=65.11 TRINITY_DN40236_c0_g1_i1:47-868(+)
MHSPCDAAAAESDADRNLLHEIADDIRERGVIGSAVNAVKENPLLLLPGGTLLTLAHRQLTATGSEAAENCGAAAGGFDGFDIATALAPTEDSGAVDATGPAHRELDSSWRLAVVDAQELVDSVATGAREPEEAVQQLLVLPCGNPCAWADELVSALQARLSSAYLGMGDEADPDAAIFRLLRLLHELHRCQGVCVVAGVIVATVLASSADELNSLLCHAQLGARAAPLLQDLSALPRDHASQATHQVVAEPTPPAAVQSKPAPVPDLIDLLA